MGNKPDRSRKMQQPYNQMVEDAIAALKDRPGSTQADIFNYLEAKYEGKISPKNKHNLQTVIRSVIQSKKRLRSGNCMGRSSSGRGSRGGGGTSRLKAKGGLRRKLGRGSHRVQGMKGLKINMSKSVKALKTPPNMGKSKLVNNMARSKGRGGTGRGGKLVLRPARRTTSEGSMCLSRMNGRMRRN